MKSRKLVWITVLCLLSATVIAVSLRTHSTAVLAAQHSVSRASLAQPAAYMSSASLRAAAISNALLSDEAGSAQRVLLNLQPNRPVLPSVEVFTLSPPNPAQNIDKTVLSVRFVGSAAEKLSSQIPMTLGNQNVVLQRSSNDPRTFVASLDFDWQTFAKVQQRRKEAASRGRIVPVFDGPRLVRTERMQFLEPKEIRAALQSHQSIQFSPDILIPDTVTVTNDHELMIVDPAVVEDAGGRTFDPCLNTSNQSPNGAWTFKTLMMSIRNGSVQDAEQMLSDWLLTWENQELKINGFSVPSRAGMASGNGVRGLFAVWPRDESGNLCTIQGTQQACLSLATAPVRLNAIVNRIDLGGLPNETPIGELRFVFGVSASLNGLCSPAAEPFNIILEFGVPQNANIPSINTWADDWNALQPLSFTDESFQVALQTMTNLVVAPGACPSNPNGSCLSQIRTNEVELGESSNFWEQRQFSLNPQNQQNSELIEVMISQTPDGSFTGFSGGGNLGAPPCSGSPNGCTTPSQEGDVTAFISANQALLDNGTYVVPPCFGSQTDVPPCPATNPAFLGGSAFNGPDGAGPTAYWNGDPSSGLHKERVIFSEGTCNGCHGAETEVHFQQVANRLQGQAPSPLSAFLVGCNTNIPLTAACNNTTCTPGQTNCVFTLNGAGLEKVQDPVLGSAVLPNQFGDIVRRADILVCLINPSQCGGPLWTLARPHNNFVH